MTQKHVNNSQYRINNPNYVDPDYKTSHFNAYLKAEKIDVLAPENYLQQYLNNRTINRNYNHDIGISQGFLNCKYRTADKDIKNKLYKVKNVYVTPFCKLIEPKGPLLANSGTSEFT